MPNCLPNFDTLPSHILSQIAGYSDEITIWRMMAVCHSVRLGAEMALKPYLESKVLVVDRPPLDLFHPIDPDSDLAANDRTRRKALRKASDLLSRHFAAYPPSSSLLRRLCVELRDDCDYSGWVHLRNLAPQLVQLEVHMLDKLWTLDQWGENPDGDITTYGIKRRASNGYSVWKRVLDYSEIQLSLLTSLHLHASARLIHHFAGLVRSLPQLRDLTMSCHWYDRDVDENHVDLEGFNADELKSVIPQSFPKLRSLTMMGDETTMVMVSKYVLAGAHNLRFFTLNITDWPAEVEGRPVTGSVSESLLVILVHLAKCSALEGAAFYGRCTGHAMHRLHLADDNALTGNGGFSNLRTLVAEAELREGDSSWMIHLPPNAPALAALQHFIVVSKAAISADFDSAALEPLQVLFQQYPTLETVRWIAGYPDDPFGQITGLSDASDSFQTVIRRDDDWHGSSIDFTSGGAGVKGLSWQYEYV